MTEQVLVGLAQAAEADPARRYACDLVRGLVTVGVDVRVAALRDGPVRVELGQHAPVKVMEDLRPRTPAGLAESALRRVSPALGAVVRSARLADRRRWLGEPQTIHLNSPQAVTLLRYVMGRNAVTTYVHPDDLAVDALAPVDRDLLVERTDRFLAASPSTADRLVERAGVDPARVVLAPERLTVPAPALPTDVRHSARRAVGLPPTGVVIGAPPVPDWMEAPDLTIAVAWELQRRRGDTAPHLLWFGGPDDERRRWPIEHDLARTGLASVHLANPPEGIDPLALVDLVVLPSRTSEPVSPGFIDQAVAHGVPVLCWAGDPRAKEVAAWTGSVVASPDVAAMADAVLALVDDGERRRDLAGHGRRLLLGQLELVVPTARKTP